MAVVAQLTNSPPSEKDIPCASCQTIDFDRYLGEQLPVPIRLGSWKALLANQTCPFCRLTTHTLQSDPQLMPADGNASIYLDNKPSFELGAEYSPYSPVKIDSLSSKNELKAYAKEFCQHTAYRYQVSTRQTRSARKGQIQYLAHMERDPDMRQFFGRPVVQQQVDIELLKSWLGRCKKHHGSVCDRCVVASPAQPPAGFRLIDVIKRKIVRVSSTNHHPEFAALSYVAGKEMLRTQGLDTAVLKKRDIARWGRDTRMPRKLPRTIEDAILLSRVLGFQYLWVDTLCTVQDESLHHRAQQLASVHAVFSRASLTIVAGAGTHADHGLPGISCPRKHFQYSERIKGLRLASMFPSYSDLSESKSLLWNTRAWTFQEKLLSRRILLFTEYQVYYKCSESIYTEEIAMELPRPPPLSSLGDTKPAKFRWSPESHYGKPSLLSKTATRQLFNNTVNMNMELQSMFSFEKYSSLISEYTTRSLSNPREIFFAIFGPLDALEPHTGKFLFGLPESHLLDGMLWCPSPGSMITRSQELEGNIPSWSWASWNFRWKGLRYNLESEHFVREILLNYGPDSVDANGGWVGRALRVSGELEEDWILQTITEIFTLLPFLMRNYSIEEMSYSQAGHSRKVDLQFPLQGTYPGSAASKPSNRLSKALTSIIPEQNVAARQTMHHLFAGGDMTLEEAQNTTNTMANPATSLPRPAKKTSRWGIPALVFKTSVISFRIGNILSGSHSKIDLETGVFELCDENMLVVGEVCTTFGIAKRIYKMGNMGTCLTINWGAGMERAEVHQKFVPKWKVPTSPTQAGAMEHARSASFAEGFSARRSSIFGSARMSFSSLDRSAITGAFGIRRWSSNAPTERGRELSSRAPSTVRTAASSMTRAESYRTGSSRTFVSGSSARSRSSHAAAPPTPSSSPLQSIIDNAKQGEALPRNLWPCVNLLLVDLDGGRATRLGVAKVIMGAWEEAKTFGREIIFV